MKRLAPLSRPRRILMTVDAAGGVWRYAMDLAAEMKPRGFETVFACFGPHPSPAQRAEAQAIGTLITCDMPLDWMAHDAAELAGIPDLIARLVSEQRIDILHLNLPSQAAGLRVPVPVLVVSHSCVCTWFAAVRGHGVPDNWAWQLELNRRGFEAADVIVMPSQSHADLSASVYGPLERMRVVYNASRMRVPDGAKAAYVFAAGRWWDDGKNGAVLDAAARDIRWPVIMAGSDQGPNGQHLPLSNVDRRGELSHAETVSLMAGAAIVVSPSLYEPFGLAALEAARCGAALVLADIPTYRELWDGAALFADPRDPDAFAAAINRLADDPALRAELGQQAKSRAASFSPDAQANAMAGLYHDLLTAERTLTAAE